MKILRILNRRQFVQSSGVALSSLYLSPIMPIAKAFADAEDHFFISMNIFGGMDVTLGLDPWVMPEGCDQNDMFIEYSPDKIMSASGLKFAPAAQPLLPFADRCAVINGVMMSDTDNGHQVLNLYAATGNGQGKSPYLPVELACACDNGPYGVLTTSSLVLGKRRVVVSDADVLKGSKSALDYIDILSRMKINPDESPVDLAKQSILNAKDVSNKFYAILENMKGTGKITDLDNEHVFAAAFLSGASKQAYMFVEPKLNMDTHNDHEGNHLKAQSAAWESVAKMLNTLKDTPYGKSGKSLLDVTTVMVTDEFSRTPYLNAGKGKDHNPYTNSVLLVGKGVNPGTYGASKLISRKGSPTKKAIHMGRPIDYVTGQVPDLTPDGDISANVDFIYPENIIQTVSQIMGADPRKFQSVPAETKVIPGLAKNEVRRSQ